MAYLDRYMTYPSCGPGGSVELIMDKISHGDIQSVSQSSRFCFTVNTTLVYDHIMFLFYLHFFPAVKITRVIKSKIIRSAEHVARGGRGEVHTGL